MGEGVTEFKERVRGLRSKSDTPLPVLVAMLADGYDYKIEKGNQGVYKHLVPYSGMHNRTRTLEQRMEHLNAQDTSLNKSQQGGSFNMKTTITTNAPARKMASKTGGTIGTAGTAKDHGLTGYNCGQVGQSSCNCTSRDLLKKLLEQALDSQDALKAKLGRLDKDTRRGGVVTGGKEIGQLAKEKEAMQEMHREAESEFQCFSDSDPEAGKGNCGPYVRLYVP
jgi:hypothetical protein